MFDRQLDGWSGKTLVCECGALFDLHPILPEQVHTDRYAGSTNPAEHAMCFRDNSTDIERWQKWIYCHLTVAMTDIGETSVSAVIIKSLLHHRTPIYDTRRCSCTSRQTVPPDGAGKRYFACLRLPPPFEMRYGSTLEPLPLTQVRKGGHSCCDISVPPPHDCGQKGDPKSEEFSLPSSHHALTDVHRCLWLYLLPPAFLVTQATMLGVTFLFSCMKTPPPTPVWLHTGTRTLRQACPPPITSPTKWRAEVNGEQAEDWGAKVRAVGTQPRPNGDQ